MDELPLRFPASSADPTQAAGDLDPEADRAPGLIETLRGTVDASPVFEEAGADDTLLESLDAAQVELDRSKRENRRAIREANRQLRVGSAANAPHLILITLSDIAHADFACYGGTTPTPNLDAFAAQAMRFTDYYASSIDPRGARWSLLTGLNVGRAPSNQEDHRRFDVHTSSRQSLPDVLWLAGYSTSFVGIWRENASPLEHGCDEWSGVLSTSRVLDPFPEFLFLDETKARLLPNADDQAGLPVADFLLDEALASLARRTSADRPCFVHLALSPQLMPPSDAAGMLPDFTAGQLRELDAGLGRFLARIEELGLGSTTCVIISGELAPEVTAIGYESSPTRTGLLRASSDGLSEGNLRVPLLVRWPGRVEPGSVSDHPCAIWDLLPTLADLAGAQRRPSRLDGLSFAPELLGRAQREHTLLYWETREQGFGQAVRKGHWKGVRAPDSTALRLYDLSSDPGEALDVAHAHPEIVDQLRAPGR
jgi:arylsulfatase A-like enzyme